MQTAQQQRDSETPPEPRRDTTDLTLDDWCGADPEGFAKELDQAYQDFGQDILFNRVKFGGDHGMSNVGDVVERMEQRLAAEVNRGAGWVSRLSD